MKNNYDPRRRQRKRNPKHSGVHFPLKKFAAMSLFAKTTCCKHVYFWKYDMKTGINTGRLLEADQFY